MPSYLLKFSCPPSLYDTLKARALQENRSVSNLIVTLIRQALAAEKVTQ
jgi:hypothetical protein